MRGLRGGDQSDSTVPTGSVSEPLRSGGVPGGAALGRQVSIKRPNGALSVSCQIRYDEVSDSVCRFRASLRAKRSPDRLSANNCASTAAASRNVVDLRSLTHDLKRANPRAASLRFRPDSDGIARMRSTPFFLQCKGKGVKGQPRRESQAAGARKKAGVAEPPLRGFRRCRRFPRC